MNKKNNWRTFLGFILSALLLWLTFYKSGLRLQNINLNNTQLFYFILAIIIFIFSIWLFSIRAKLFWVTSNNKIKKIDTYNSLLIGNFYNCLLPGNLGEGLRALHFSKKNKVSFINSLSSIIAEKCIDTQFFFFLSIIIFVIKPFISNYILYTIGITTLIIFISSIIYFIMVNFRSFEKKIVLILFRLKKTGRALFKLYWYSKKHISNINKNKVIAYYILLCFVIFFLNVSQFFFLLKASGVSEPISNWYSAYLVALSMMIIAFIPSAPGNIGVIHFGVYSILILSANQLGIEPDELNLQSFARFGIYVHLSYLIPEIFLGGIIVIKENRYIFNKKE